MIELFCETEGLGYGTDMELPKEAQERWEKPDFQEYPFDDNMVEWFFTLVTVIGEHEKEVTEFIQNMNCEKILEDFSIDCEGLNNIANYLSWNDSEHAINRPSLSPFNIVKCYDVDLEKLTNERVCARFKILHSSIAW